VSFVVNAAVAGAAKCGTTSLKEYLGEHPELTTHPQLEFGFFQSRREQQLGLDAVARKYELSGARSRVLIKNAGLMYDDAGLARLQAHNPAAKVVVVLRDPTERAYSSYLHEVALGHEAWRPFPEYLDGLLRDRRSAAYRIHLLKSRYSTYLRSLRERFGANLRCVLYDELRDDPGRLVGSLLEFIGVRADFTPRLERRHNESFAIRSAAAAQWTARLMDEGSPLKDWAARVLPFGTARRAADWVRGLNRRPVRFERLDPESRRRLDRFFDDELDTLEGEFGLPVRRWRSVS